MQCQCLFCALDTKLTGICAVRVQAKRASSVWDIHRRSFRSWWTQGRQSREVANARLREPRGPLRVYYRKTRRRLSEGRGLGGVAVISGVLHPPAGNSQRSTAYIVTSCGKGDTVLEVKKVRGRSWIGVLQGSTGEITLR